MGCGWRPEKSRLFKSWMKDNAQVRDACRGNLEEKGNRSPKIPKSVHTQPCSCTAWIQALIHILDALS